VADNVTVPRNYQYFVNKFKKYNLDNDEKEVEIEDKERRPSVLGTVKDKKEGLYAGFHGGAYTDRLKHLNILDFTKPNDVNGTRCIDVVIA